MKNKYTNMYLIIWGGKKTLLQPNLRPPLEFEDQSLNQKKIQLQASEPTST
jgi:hypothetical protein